MKAIISLLCHASCAVFHMYSIHWLMFGLGLNLLEMTTYFTNWTIMFHLLMFLTLAAHDAARMFNDQEAQQGDNSSKNIEIFLNNENFLGLFLHLAIVMSSFTQLVFWLLFNIDREIILPEAVGFPATLNHMVHTFPLFMALAAVYLFSSNFQSAREEKNCESISRGGLKFIGLLAFGYLFITLILFELKGVWPYPFMFSFSRVDFFIFSLCAFLGSLFLSYLCSFVETKIKKFKI